MARSIRKIPFPVADIRRYLEPGPVLLVTSRWKGEDNIMTLGWHCVMEFSPSLVGCMISSGNHSHQMIRRSRQCVLNLPTRALLDETVRVGNSTGTELDKFTEFGLTAESASKVDVPMIAECHASFECVLREDALVKGYDFFVFEVVAAHVAPRPARPETIHYRGNGEFMLAGGHVSRKAMFTKVL